jgi:hypothetical protein
MAVELGEDDPKVTLDHFVRLFVNHRSVFDIERKNFEEVLMLPRCTSAQPRRYSLLQAFETLGTIGSNLLRSQRLIEVLAGAGEKMTKAEIDECIYAINRSVCIAVVSCHDHCNCDFTGRFKVQTSCRLSSVARSLVRSCCCSRNSRPMRSRNSSKTAA